MNDIIDFFVAPYTTATAFDITLEVLAVLLGILSVWYAKKENILVFPTGIISTILYVYICFKFVLYGDVIINIYYTMMSLYGWFMWQRKIKGKTIAIAQSTTKDMMWALVIFVSTAAFVVLVYLYFDRFNRITDYFDTFTTGVFFAAMWLMANKKIEHWLFWIVGNLISIPLYFVKGLGFSGLQFTVFLMLAIQGYFEWKKHLNK
ncbi:MAG: nicotinamide riboside transporter PnuC [Flavobacteriaceae bacterium]|jgi:nicotinamide mononucleotide transporter|nr:nicotinamide riboside transporter PnuC [Flavobacteriaceae bacterium]